MNRLCLGLSCLLTLSPVVSLSQLIAWNDAPHKGFVFQITNKEAQQLLTRNSPDTIFLGLLHTPIDTFDVRKGWTRRPEKGHFITVSIEENKLNCEYTSVFPYQVYLLKEYNALALQVLDLDGNVRDDAVVRVKNLRVRIDRESKTYRLSNEWFGGDDRIVTVELDGFRSVFNVTRHPVPSWDNEWNYRDGPTFYSYLLTDKNMYRPNEKVRFKSYALSSWGKPLRKPLEIWVTDYRNHKKVGKLEPQRPGTYAGEFVLHDSLKLKLDEGYTITLQEKGGRTVANSRFRLEDYELNGNKLDVRLAESSQFYPLANTLTIQATDVNGLMLKDGRATVVVTTEDIRETFQPLVVLPDTLMELEIDLNPSEPTRVEIPARLFSKANVAYEVAVEVRNSENKVVQSTAFASHFYSHHELKARYSNDSLILEYFSNGKPMPITPFRIRTNNEETPRMVMLPYKEKINPAIRTLHVVGDSVSREFDLSNMIPKIRLNGGVAGDSLHLVMENPQQLEVSWFIYQGDELVRKGSGKELRVDTLITNRSETYYAELLCSFGGEDHIIHKEFPFRDDLLTVSLALPDRVYPGQKADARIQVTDGRGLPVSDVDLTALGVTAKLNYSLPDLPYYGTLSSPRPRKATFTKRDISKRSVKLDLNFRKWEEAAGLDTMKYYQFTYPIYNMFRHSVPIKDSTQFAPFVMKGGAAIKVYVIELNHTPVYFSWADQPKAYSFYVPSDRKVSLSMRLHDRVLLFDSLSFPRGHKTIISVDLDNLPARVSTYPIPSLTPRQRKRWIERQFTKVEERRYLPYVSSFRYRSGNTYLEGNGSFVPLFLSREFSHRNIVVGPVEPARYTFHAPAEPLSITYRHEGGYEYSVDENVVYKLTATDLLPKRLFHETYRPMRVINNLVMTKEEFLNTSYYTEPVHLRSVKLVEPSLHIKVQLPEEQARSGFATLLFQNCGTGQISAPCPGSPGTFQVPRGCQQVVALYNNGTYLKMDSVNIRSYHHYAIDLNKAELQPADAIWSGWLTRTSVDCYRLPENRVISMRKRSGRQSGNIRGSVYAAEDGSPLPGVNIVEKGTVNGTITDTEGQFALYSENDKVTLVISFIGYGTEEVEVEAGAEVSVQMEADVMQLSEVVVTAQSITMDKRALGYAVSSFSGSRFSPDLDVEAVEEAEDISSDDRVYQELLQLNTLRTHFRDVAFWEPSLYTDKRGQSGFTVEFPDDITRWEATVYAMNRRLQTGTGRRTIKSYKPIMAELLTPNFLTVGDTAQFLGRVVNHSDDRNISGRVSWTGSPADAELPIRFSDFHLDRLRVIAASSDSVMFRYVFNRDDGYMDGEERKVPVVEPGTERADGSLTTLVNGGETRIAAAANKQITIDLMANPIEVYTREARDLISYRYDCNEQLASKLAGLITYRLIMQYEGKPFPYDREVNRIIGRLLRNQNKEFLWSWWDVSPHTSYWMSAHILRSLRAAADAGYDVDIDLDNLGRKMNYKYMFLNEYSLSDADLLNALSAWDVKLDYARHLAKIEDILKMEKQDPKTKLRGWTPPSHLQELLLLQEVRLVRNLNYRRDSLLKYQKKGILGNVYFSDNHKPTYWYQDDLAVNAVAYRIIRKDTTLRDLVVPHQLYFLADRSKRSWNTYQSAKVMMDVLVDLLSEGSTHGSPATVQVAGKISTTINNFPYRIELLPGEAVTLRKEAGMPIFLMNYTKERVTKAATGVEGFAIHTSLAPRLEAGKETTLRVEVNVSKEADQEYVMIEVPIPGSCSYANKASGRNGVETHREYFKDRVVIFCQNMKSGTYSFDIALLPRFSGSYGINPAQISLMYFPVVNANTDMKRVNVGLGER